MVDQGTGHGDLYTQMRGRGWREKGMGGNTGVCCALTVLHILYIHIIRQVGTSGLIYQLYVDLPIIFYIVYTCIVINYTWVCVNTANC